MSRVTLSLRLRGELPSSDELTRTIGVTPTETRRCGDVVGKRRIQPIDVWYLDLAQFDSDSTSDQILNQIMQATTTLQQIAPALATLDLDTTSCNAELYTSIIQEEDQGGFTLPRELLAAVADAKLSIEFSILVMLDDYEPGQ